jgi:LCP family protein required for cell wall assembly
MPKPHKKHQPKRFDVHRTLQSTDRRYTAPTLDELNQAKPDDKKTRKRLRFAWKKALLLVFIIILAPVLYFGTWDYHNFSKASKKLFGSGNLVAALPPNSIKNQQGRTNILLAGFSADDPGHSGAKLTDSIMILSMDKDTQTGYMLSLPRDLYVNIPGYGYAKINEAYLRGEQSKFSEPGYAKGGMGMIEKVISEDFGIKMDYYVLINYGAVKDTVAALHGISVNIQSRDPRGIYDGNFLPKEGGALKLKNGRQTIDAQTALRLTRARGDNPYKTYGLSQSDFDRTKNQREVIKGIKEKLTWKLLIDPRKNEPILSAFADNIKTDIGISNVLPAYKLFSSIPESKLQSVGLRDESKKINLLTSYRTPTGQSALVPAAGIGNYDEIKALIRHLSQ